jgi:ABC-2 type transport system permease protein
MNTQSDAVPEYPIDPRETPPAALAETRLLYWSVRRELWEFRSIYIVPLAFAAVSLFGFLISTIHLPGKIRAASALDSMKQYEVIQQPYHLVALFIMGACFFLALFYSLEALHGERRDRSLLFWKSLPVSDLTTVLSKASIPIVVLPLIAFVVTIATQWLMLLFSSVVLLGNGLSVGMLWTHVMWVQMSVMLLFHLLAMHGLWYAPIYCWLLLVSAWARRVPVLWAVLPLFAIGVFEKVVFNSSHLAAFLRDYFFGGGQGGERTAAGGSLDPMGQLGLGQFLTSPGLWIGLAIAAAFLAGAIRLRHNREPI